MNGYELHLLEVRKFVDVELFRSDLREVFGAIPCAGDKEKVREFIDENEHNLMQMGEDALDMIREVAEITMPEKYGNKDGKEDEDMNLCQGIKDWIAEGNYRSLNGAADESIFQGRACKAGYFGIRSVWTERFRMKM